MSALPYEPLITAVTLAELSVGPFDADAARAFARVAASLRSAGRKPTARSFDALIAATALAHQLPIYTCNAGDFDGIGGLDVVAVPVDDEARAMPMSPLPPG